MTESVSICFLCGCEAKTEFVDTVIGDSKLGSFDTPVFPWLRTTTPAPGALGPLGFAGKVQCCRVCYQLLISQWNIHEDRKTPLIQRQYWSKSWCSDTIYGGSAKGLNSSSDTRHTSRPASTTSTSTTSPSVASASEGQSAGNLRFKSCVLCSKRVNCADSKEFRVVNTEIICKIAPGIAATSNFSADSDCLVCSSCFEAPYFQLGLKSKVSSVANNASGLNTVLGNASGANLGYEQAAMLYQLMLQQVAVLQTPTNQLGAPHQQNLQAAELLAHLSSKTVPSISTSVRVNDAAVKPPEKKAKQSPMKKPKVVKTEDSSKKSNVNHME